MNRACLFAILAGCGATHEEPGTTPPPTGVSVAGTGSGVTLPQPPVSPPQQACHGSAFEDALGLARPDQVGHVAVDAGGNVRFASASGGVVALSPAGATQFTLPVGSFVATNQAGDVIVAGSFTAPITIGGQTLVPAGTIDVFVAVLDATGSLLSAQALGQCGDGLVGLAVARDGRIAVSGTMMGTVVLTPAGEVVPVSALAGPTGFADDGDLAIAAPAAIVALDPSYATHWQLPVSGDVQMTAVSAGAHVAVSGFTTTSVDLFGHTIAARLDPQSGRVTGGFAVKLELDGTTDFVADAGLVEANGVALAGDELVVSGAETGNAGFFRIVALEVFDASGVGTGHQDMFPASGYGRAFDVAVDACGNAITALVALDTPQPGSPLRAYVVKMPIP